VKAANEMMGINTVSTCDILQEILATCNYLVGSKRLVEQG